MFDKLDFILEKYEELSQKVSDPEIINNQPVWQKYVKEMSDMEPIVKKYKEYKKVKGIRPDYYNPKTKTIYELKPYNPRSAKAGVKQLKKYKKKIGKRSNVRLEFY